MTPARDPKHCFLLDRLPLGKPRKVERPKKEEGGKAPGWAPEIMPKHKKSLPNGRQQEPQGGGAKRRPIEAAPQAPPCCLRFGKDFLCFWCISGPLLGLHGPSPPRKLRHRSAPHAYSGTYSTCLCLSILVVALVFHLVRISYVFA